MIGDMGRGRKRNGNAKKSSKSKKARKNAQRELNAGRAARAELGEEDDWGDETAENGGGPCSGAYVSQAFEKAKPRPSSRADRLAELLDRDLFGVISTEFEKARGYGFLVCDETGEEMPFSDTRPEFTEGEEVGFRIKYGPQREPMT